MIRVIVSGPGQFKDQLMKNAPQFAASIDDAQVPLTDWLELTDGTSLAASVDGALFTIITGDQGIELAVVGAGQAPTEVIPIPIPAQYAYTGIISGHDNFDLYIQGA